MGRRKDSVMTSLWLDQTDHAEIERRAVALHVSKAEVIRRMIRWGHHGREAGETMSDLPLIQLDLATAIARIEQIATLPEGDSLREFLLDRLIRCDAPRLREHLTVEATAALARAQE